MLGHLAIIINLLHFEHKLIFITILYIKFYFIEDMLEGIETHCIDWKSFLPGFEH